MDQPSFIRFFQYSDRLICIGNAPPGLSGEAVYVIDHSGTVEASDLQGETVSGITEPGA